MVKERIEFAFKKNRSLAKSDVHVASVNKGVVLLSGDAADIVEHLRAIETAYLVKGVRGFDAIVLTVRAGRACQRNQTPAGARD